MRLLDVAVIGEILWDVFPDAERLGGASFNFAAHLARFGHRVRFFSAVGDDDRGHRALERMRQLGLATEHVAIVPHPTGTVTVEIRDGQPSYTLHRPAAYDFVETEQRNPQPPADWIYFGTLHYVQPKPRLALANLLAANPHAMRFCDVNLRRDCYTLELVEQLLSGTDVVKLNEAEELELQSAFGDLEERFSIGCVCITRGERGCTIRRGSERVEAPASPIQVADTVGAGDAFAAAFLHGLIQEWPLQRVGEFANRLGALVASRPGAIPDWSLQELE